jgi:hypothetical protein
MKGLCLKCGCEISDTSMSHYPEKAGCLDHVVMCDLDRSKNLICLYSNYRSNYFPEVIKPLSTSDATHFFAPKNWIGV